MDWTKAKPRFYGKPWLEPGQAKARPRPRGLALAWKKWNQGQGKPGQSHGFRPSQGQHITTQSQETCHNTHLCSTVVLIFYLPSLHALFFFSFSFLCTISLFFSIVYLLYFRLPISALSSQINILGHQGNTWRPILATFKFPPLP